MLSQPLLLSFKLSLVAINNPIQGYTHPDYHILPYLRKKMIIIHYNNKWNRIYDYFTGFYVFTDSYFLYLVTFN